MTLRDHVLLMLGFSARAGSYPARSDRTAASVWLTASQGVCILTGRLSPYLQEQQDGHPTTPKR